MTIIYLIRHGAYDSPTPVVPYRLPGFHLSDQGKKQVEALASTLTNENITAVYTSPMERTQETAAILARPFNLKPIVDDRLNEVRSPAQGKTKEYIDSLGGWLIYESPWYLEHAGETIGEIVSRMCEVIEEKRIQHVGQSVILVSHGDPIMLAAVNYQQGLMVIPASLNHIPYLPLAGGYRLEFSDTKSVVVSTI